MCDTSTKGKTNGTRLRRLLLDGGTQVLRERLDRIFCPSALPAVLKSNETKINSKKIVRYDDQIELLFPSDGSRPDSKNFDITLLSSLLASSICNLKAPSKGWHDKPDDSDRSEEANIVRIKLFRNKVQQFPSSEIDDSMFEKLWNELSVPLKDLGLQENEIGNLKIAPIDDESEIQERFRKWCGRCGHEERIGKLEDTVNALEVLGEKLQNKGKTTPKGCIPEEPLIFIGREKELEKIIKAKTVDEKPFVLIHGMVGIGKSTLIKKASWDLEKNHGKTVYFVDLYQCEASEEAISKTINYILQGPNVSNEPRDALINWAKNLEDNVILVLDNAEDVITSQPQQTGNHRETGMCFEKILLKIREFSNQKVDYLVASREIFTLTDLSTERIELSHFGNNESLLLINEMYDGSDLTEDQKQTIAELCFHIPIFVRLVIPLLDDYSPENLIQKLKSNSTSDEISQIKCLEKTVSLSFEKLGDGLLFLVQLTVFNGPFDIDSAKAVTGSTEQITVENLKTLLKKSLLQKDERKYTFHPFIHKFVVGYGKANLKELLQESTVKFRNHFLTLLFECTKLYWTKDSCKESLSAFFKDRVHFESALEMLCHTEESSNTHNILFERFTDIVKYLESCISWDLLERLLENFIILARKNTDFFSRELESVCWKGHIVRRRGDEEEYKKLVEQADTLYTRSQAGNENNGVVLDDRAILCYKTAKGRYFSHIEDAEQGVKTFQEIINSYKERVVEDPSMNEDYARAIVELGHNLKHKKEYKKAVEKYEQASVIYEKQLGEHICTALSFKDIADGYMIQDTQNTYEEAQTYYNRAIAMLTLLNSDSETHMILLMKNTGICSRNLKKYKKSEKQFKKALSIADKNLKENHKYKCWVKEELFYLYQDMVEMEKARILAKEALEMATN